MARNREMAEREDDLHVRFGDGIYELDERESLLLKNGKPARLQPLPFKVLSILLRNAGHLVYRHELQVAWDGRPNPGFHAALSSAIYKLRQALSPKVRKALITVPKEGFKFTGDVTVVEEEAKKARPGLPQPILSISSPYRGLEPFRMMDQAFFFGRGKVTHQLLEKARCLPFLAVVGPSGVGKSSLIQAGVLPLLKSDQWAVLRVRPLESPLSQAACAVGERLGCSGKSLFKKWQEEDATLLDDLQKICDKNQKGVVLYIDQFEELYTLSNEKRRRCFLQEALCFGENRPAWTEECFKVIVSFRSEFLDWALQDPQLQTLLEKYGTQPIGEMSEDDIREVITRPAEARRVTVEPALVERIVREIGDERQGVLPLLEHCLSRIWTEQRPREGDVLTVDTYNRLGHFRGAISDHANDVIRGLRRQGLDDVTRGILEQLVLVDVDDPKRDTRQPARIARLSQVPQLGGPEKVDRVIEELTSQKARLVVRDGDSIELAHEVLIREWPALKEWIKEDRAFRINVRRVVSYAESSDRLPLGLLKEGIRWLDDPVLASKLDRAVRSLIETSLMKHIGMQIDSLLDSRVDLLPTLLKDCDFPQRTRECLAHTLRCQEPAPHSNWTIDDEALRRIRFVCVSLGAVDEVENLCEDMLVCEASEFTVIRDALRPFDVTTRLWKVLSDRSRSTSQRLRAACALATYDSENSRWKSAATFVVDQLIRENVLHLPVWCDSLRPVRFQLFSSLRRVAVDPSRLAVERQRAADLLVHLAPDRPEELTGLLLQAEPSQFRSAFRSLEVHGEKGVSLCRDALSRAVAKRSRKRRGMITIEDRVAQEFCNASTALLRFGRQADVLKALRGAPNAESLARFLHGVKAREVDAHELIQLLYDVQNARTEFPGRQNMGEERVVYTLLLALGEFQLNDLARRDRKDLLDRLLDWYANDPRAGVHGAAGWLLRHWGKVELTSSVDETAFSFSPDRQWFTARIDAGSKPWSGPDFYTFVVLGPAEYRMGSPNWEPDRDRDEESHLVRLTRSFAICDCPVTRRQFEHFLHKKFSIIDQWAPTGRHPALYVSWNEAVRFCRWLTEKAGMTESDQCHTDPEAEGEVAFHPERCGFRLPTEAEWEYACRAGSLSSFHFGRDSTLLEKYAWFHRNARRQSHEVRQLRPNPFGLFDMHGNVLEWCQDWHDPSYYAESPKDDPTGPLSGTDRVLRGGGWRYDEFEGRSASRNLFDPSARSSIIGLRVVVSCGEQKPA